MQALYLWFKLQMCFFRYKNGGDAMRIDKEVKVEGIKVLIENLGYVDAERFMMLMNKEFLNYLKYQSMNLDRDIEMPDLRERLEEYERQLES